jgi:hypothetical protein
MLVAITGSNPTAIDTGLAENANAKPIGQAGERRAQVLSESSHKVGIDGLFSRRDPDALELPTRRGEWRAVRITRGMAHHHHDNCSVFGRAVWVGR